MDKPSFLGKIHSKYIFQTIFSYIKFKNIKIHLFKYSKLLQKKVGLSLEDYKVNYIKNLKLPLHDYLDNTDNFDKDYKNKKLKNDMIKYKFNFNDLIAYANDLYQEYIKKNEIIDPDSLIDTIDIYSPFFEPFSLKEFFEKLFTLIIPIKLIKNYNLLNDYIFAFYKLNKLNSNYPKLELKRKDGNDIEYLKRLNLNFNKVKKLTVKIGKKHGFIGSYNCLFENLFTLPDIQHSLIFLEIEGVKPQKDYNINSCSDEDEENEEQEEEIFENLNKFELLEKLIMRDFKFEKKFTLKLNNLKELYIFNCSNITFAENSCLNLKTLFLYSNKINTPVKGLKLPELENLEFTGGNVLKHSENNENEREDENEDEDNEKNYDLFDFESLKKLKTLKIDISDFENYINSPLESVACAAGYCNFNEDEKKMFEYLFSIKTLKIVEIQIDEISADEIKEIEGDNKSVEELRLSLNVRKTDYDFYNLQKKFPNLSFLEYKSSSYAEFLILEIIEDSNIKVNKLSISGERYIKNKFYIESFESLKLISLNIHSTEIRNLEEAFPFFNNNCKVVFKSLTDFKFYYYADSPDNKKKNLRVLYNLYNNLDMMPNLKTFFLYCNTEGVDELYYKSFIKKLLSKKLDEIRIDIQINISNDKPRSVIYYTKKELKQINPNINYYELNSNISICKLRSKLE